MINFGIKDIIDILIVALMLFYLYRLMKSSGTLSLFYGVLAFILIWVVSFEIFDMRLTGTIVDKFMSIGLLILVGDQRRAEIAAVHGCALLELEAVAGKMLRVQLKRTR